MRITTLLAAAVALVAQAEALAVRPQARDGGLARRATTTTTKTTSTKTTSTTSKTSTTSTKSSTTTSTTSTTSSKPSTTSTTLTTSSSRPASSSSTSSASAPTSTGGPMVFAHYMLITTPPNGDYTNDMKLAKAAGIDAFAVNYGGWSVDYNVQNNYLNSIYSAAAANGMKVFLSVDLTSTDTSGNKMTPAMIISLFNSVYNKPAQLYINNQPVLSSYQDWSGASFNWKTDVLAKLAAQPYFMPSSLDTSASNVFGQDVGASGYFPWIHPYQSPSDEANTDSAMAAQRASTGKKWMAGLAPWFFKRFDSNDNWAHAQDGDIFITRAANLLKLKPDFIELVTWNDWGESSYFGPYDTTNECPSCYWAKVDHSAALTVASAFIKAFKAGQTAVPAPAAGSSEGVWLYYRKQPNNVLGSSGDNGLPLPQNYDSWTNRTFVVGYFAQQTSVTVTSGSNTYQLTFPAGLSQQAVAWGYGTQGVSATRNGVTIQASKSGSVQIQAQLNQYDGNIVWV